MRTLRSVFAFAGKEIREVIRQPKLMSALILGPFAILGLFAVGFETVPPALDTVVVLPESSTLELDEEAINEEMGGRLTVVDVVADEQVALRRLADGEIGLVVVIPGDARSTVRSGEQAVVTIVHDRLDPFDKAAISTTADAAVNDFNRTLLAAVAATAQDRSGELAERLPDARRSAEALADAEARGDQNEAASARDEIAAVLDAFEENAGAALGFMAPFASGDGTGETIADRLAAARDSLEATESDPSGESAGELESSLVDLEDAIAEFRSVPPEILVQPFVADTHTISGVEVPITTFYSPAVVLVLLQHVVLTFAALSMVSERSLGTTELFRVGPVSTTELLVGKMLGYATLGAIVGSILALVVVFVFGTSMVGSWVWLAAVLALVVTASLGLGVLIAAAAGTAAQAVQYAMLALLFTIFFGGIVVSLNRLTDGVRELAFLVPATAGTEALQDVMFRGDVPRAWLLAILAGYTVVTFTVARWWLARQRVA